MSINLAAFTPSLAASAKTLWVRIRNQEAAKIDDARAMTPEECFGPAEDLKPQIWDRSDRFPKLEPDVIVALNPGGAIVGGMLYFMGNRASDFLPLTRRGGVDTQDLKRMAASHPWSARKASRSNNGR